MAAPREGKTLTFARFPGFVGKSDPSGICARSADSPRNLGSPKVRALRCCSPASCSRAGSDHLHRHDRHHHHDHHAHYHHYHHYPGCWLVGRGQACRWWTQGQALRQVLGRVLGQEQELE